MEKRFEIKTILGEGSFSKLYQAYDRKYKKEVALKVEKEDKIKKILKNEYEILKNIQGIQHIPKIMEFIENTDEKLSTIPIDKNSNCIEMELLGKNIFSFKRGFRNFNLILACDILIQCLESIENLHNKGYIHRDIKPTNFVIGKDVDKFVDYIRKPPKIELIFCPL